MMIRKLGFTAVATLFTLASCSDGGLVTASSQVSPDCADALATFDARLAKSDLDQTMKADSFVPVRDTAEMLCASGQEEMALEALNGLTESLGSLEGQDFGKRPATTDQATSKAEVADPDPQPASTAYALGAPRDDLERFYGQYELPDRPGRNLFVAAADNSNPDRPIPEGYIMIGAMWGDASNWFMSSQGETSFEQKWVNPGMPPVKVNFETDQDGNAVSMAIESSFMNYDAMPRVDDLPADW